MKGFVTAKSIFLQSNPDNSFSFFSWGKISFFRSKNIIVRSAFLISPLIQQIESLLSGSHLLTSPKVRTNKKCIYYIIIYYYLLLIRIFLRVHNYIVRFFLIWLLTVKRIFLHILLSGLWSLVYHYHYMLLSGVKSFVMFISVCMLTIQHSNVKYHRIIKLTIEGI